MAIGNLTVVLPNGAEHVIPDNGQTNEQIRSAFVSLGYANVQNASVCRTGARVVFSTPQGGTKGR